jgi:signal transduction histidine kinase
VHDLIHRVASNARKLERLLADLLDLDRLQRGIISPQRRPTDVGALVRHAVAESDLLGRRTVELETPSIVIPVDAAKVERIVENLVANAGRHTPEGSALWVRVEPGPGGVTIVVEDEGPGVPAELREAVFEPFRQGPKESVHAPGVGVGLSLVARFAELHGGRAWVEDRPGGGASFRVFLPAA